MAEAPEQEPRLDNEEEDRAEEISAETFAERKEREAQEEEQGEEGESKEGEAAAEEEEGTSKSPAKKDKSAKLAEKRRKQEERRQKELAKIAAAKQKREQEAKLKQARALSERNEWFERIDPYRVRIKKGFVPNMNTDGLIFANDAIWGGLIEELDESSKGSGGFTPSVRQVANVAGLPGILGCSLAMPDIHSGYGFSIGGIAGIDAESDEGVVSPGGVGYDINCGVRLLRTNLIEGQLEVYKKIALADALFENIPVGVGAKGSKGGSVITSKNIDDVLRKGMQFALEQKLCWPEDLEVTEEKGCMPNADPSKVSDRAKKRGLPQAGTLGSGNHYIEVQVVDEVYDEKTAEVMGLKKGQVCVMIHSGSRGLGHQACSDYLAMIDKEMVKQGIRVNDRQLASVRIKSELGQSYLKAMAAAANFAFVNRTIMAQAAREVFGKVFGKSPRDLEMYQVYDVAHNVAKLEEHEIGGKKRKVLVHRKGATRAFPPGHPEIPEKYKEIGQPVLIGGSMGTCSYVLVGTEGAMKETFGSTCHGAGRSMSRGKAVRSIGKHEVLKMLQDKGITLRIAKADLVAEEAPETYKDVDEVIETCHQAGIARKVVKLRPLIVVKG